MKNTSRKVKARARELGAIVQVTNETKRQLDVEIEAPPGSIWIASGSHWIVGNTSGGDHEGVWRDLLKDMSGKDVLTFCRETNCEVCGE